MVSHVFAFCLKVSTSVKVNFRTAGIFLGYLVATSNKHFQAIIHMVQNCHSGKQKTRWEKTNKGNYHSVSLGPGSASGGKRRKKLAWAKTKIGEQSEPRGRLLRGKGWRRLRHPFPLPRQPLGSLRSPIFFLFNPVFCLPPPPLRILVPRYHSVKGCMPLLSNISVLCHVNVQRAYFLFSSDYKDVSTSYPQLLYSPPYNLLFYFLYPFFRHVPFVSNLNRYGSGHFVA